MKKYSLGFGLFILFLMMGMTPPPEHKMNVEMKKIFNGWAVDEGVDVLIEQSGLDFSYDKALVPGSSVEKWTADLPHFSYSQTPTVKKVIELSVNSGEQLYGCYNAGIRLYYKDYQTLQKEYHALKKKLEPLGGDTESSAIKNDAGNIEYDSIVIYSPSKFKLPLVNISMARQLDGDFQLFIAYQNCLKLP